MRNTLMRHTLRDYQEECLDAHYRFFEQSPHGHPLFVMPTGSGKSLVIAEFVRRSIEAWPMTRVLILTHVRELIQQNHDEFVANWGDPIHPAGIYSAGIGRRDARARVLFAGIQSVYQRAHELGAFDLVLIDESHLVPKDGMGRYRTYLDELEKINQDVRICGYTATPYRLDGGFLHEGDGRIFTDIPYEVGLDRLIEGGHLVPLVCRIPEHVIDTSAVHTERGDFKLNELEAAATGRDLVRMSVGEVVEAGQDRNRKHWLFFVTTVRHAEMVVEELTRHGIEALAVFGHSRKDDRDQAVERFRDGDLPALVNVGCLTTGFNAPCCDLMAVMRPTQSTGLYVQMMGRGMRTYPGKHDCLVLDFGENVLRHGPINAVDPNVQGRSDSERVRVCKAFIGNGKCGATAPLSAKECEDCGNAFLKQCPGCGARIPVHDRCDCDYVRKHSSSAGTASPYEPGMEGRQKHAVQDWYFRRHVKADKPDSLCVQYICGLRSFSEWVCIEHGGYASQKADRWWQQRGGKMPLPMTVSEALLRTGELSMPSEIEVEMDGKYMRVKKLISGGAK